VAEGDAAEVERFLNALGRQMAHYIGTRQEQDEATQGFTSFDIRA